MTTPDQLTRREFLGRTAAIGAAAVASTQLGPNPATAAPDGGYQVGIYTRPWDKFDYRVALDAIVEAGFKQAGLMTTKSETRLVISGKSTDKEVQQVDEELKKRGLSVPSIYAGGIPVAKSLEAGIEGMRRIVDNCAAIGAPSRSSRTADSTPPDPNAENWSSGWATRTSASGTTRAISSGTPRERPIRSTTPPALPAW